MKRHIAKMGVADLVCPHLPQTTEEVKSLGNWKA